MAALESSSSSSLKFSSFSNSQLQFPSKSNLTITFPTFTHKISLKLPCYPLNLSISRKHQLCLLSATQQDISVKYENLEENQKENNKKKLFVGGLPWSFTASHVKDFFGECGTVTDIEIIKREDGKSGFLFVTMSSGEEALDVINKFSNHELLGRIIKVEYAKKFKKPTIRLPSLLHLNETRYKLFVSNLAWKVRATNLKQFFLDFNPVSTRVIFSPSGSSAGYGFVSFASKEEAESALSALNEKELLGRTIILNFSEKTSDKSENNE